MRRFHQQNTTIVASDSSESGESSEGEIIDLEDVKCYSDLSELGLPSPTDKNALIMPKIFTVNRQIIQAHTLIEQFNIDGTIPNLIKRSAEQAIQNPKREFQPNEEEKDVSEPMDDEIQASHRSEHPRMRHDDLERD